MQVTAAYVDPNGVRYQLDNGDSLLMKESVSCDGKKIVSYPVYVYANGRTYSARAGRFSHKTIAPAMAAIRRFEEEE